MIRRSLRILSSPKTTVTGLSILSLWVVTGTLMQAKNGLYYTQKYLFNTWIGRIGGFLPVPGMLLIALFLALNLIAAIILRIAWKWKNLGLLLVHTGLILMIGGGFASRFSASESFLTLTEGESTRFSSQSSRWEIAVWPEQQGEYDVVAADLDTFTAGDSVVLFPYPVRMELNNLYENSRPRTDRSETDELIPVVPDNDPLNNIPGARISFHSTESGDSVEMDLWGGGDTDKRFQLGGRPFLARIRPRRIPLPFTIRLIRFQALFYPGSDIAREFSSRVEFISDQEDRESFIRMNRPSRFQGYTIYQNSYSQNAEGRMQSTLSLVKNSGRLFPYAASILVFFGMLLHFFQRFRSNKKNLRNTDTGKKPGKSRPSAFRKILYPISVCILAALPFLFSIRTLPESGWEKEWKHTAILDNGRIKPMGAFAGQVWKQFSHKSAPSGETPSHWMSRLIFHPGSTHDDAVFSLRTSDLRVYLNLPEKRESRYSFRELMPAFNPLRELAIRSSGNKSGGISAMEDEAVGLFSNFLLYYRLSRAFDWVRAEDRLQSSSGDPLSVWDWISSRNRDENGSEIVNEIVKAYGSSPFSIFPREGTGGDWDSPWTLVSRTLNEKKTLSPLLSTWAQIASAMRHERTNTAALLLARFNGSIRKSLQRSGFNPVRLNLEIIYLRSNPFFFSLVFYGISFLFSLLFLLIRRPAFLRLSTSFIISGWILHTTGLALRFLISRRPPVTNMYETFLFVAWSAVILSGFIEFKRRNGIGWISGSFSGLLFLLLSLSYTFQGDTMGRLVAVLNTHLWLTVHVLTITLGYAGCVVAGVIGHIYLLQILQKQPAREQASATLRSLYGTMIFALLLTFIGTVMGGIWADLSWGRFWGWDPKENGALLIILWLSIVLHARLDHLIGDRGLGIGGIISAITVVLAWFGVNLLGVGLHSYGFISGVNRTLTVYIGMEILFILFVLLRLKNPNKETVRPN